MLSNSSYVRMLTINQLKIIIIIIVIIINVFTVITNKIPPELWETLPVYWPSS